MLQITLFPKAVTCPIRENLCVSIHFPQYGKQQLWERKVMGSFIRKTTLRRRGKALPPNAIPALGPSSPMVVLYRSVIDHFFTLKTLHILQLFLRHKFVLTRFGSISNCTTCMCFLKSFTFFNNNSLINTFPVEKDHFRLERHRGSDKRKLQDQPKLY